MKYHYHVVTPFSRLENLQIIGQHVKDCGADWHPLFNDSLCFRLKESGWLKPVFCSPVPAGWNPGHHVINEFIINEPIVPEDRYLILCDDDWYEPGFFDKLDREEGSLLFCSMLRGHHQPPNMPHGIATLVAARENLTPGNVGVEQMIISGERLKLIRFGPSNISDGEVIRGLAGEPNITFVKDAFVWFNYLQPGRWDK